MIIIKNISFKISFIENVIIKFLYASYLAHTITSVFLL